MELSVSLFGSVLVSIFILLAKFLFPCTQNSIKWQVRRRYREYSSPCVYLHTIGGSIFIPQNIHTADYILSLRNGTLIHMLLTFRVLFFFAFRCCRFLFVNSLYFPLSLWLLLLYFRHRIGFLKDNHCFLLPAFVFPLCPNYLKDCCCGFVAYQLRIKVENLLLQYLCYLRVLSRKSSYYH